MRSLLGPGLPKVGEYGSILVVVDLFSKYATFIPAPTYCSAEETTYLFLKYIVKYWGVPRNIVSDRDSRFTGRFWTKLGLSSISRPVVIPGGANSMLEEYLRHFCEWGKILDVAQFCFNLQRSSSSNKSPFELITGQ